MSKLPCAEIAVAAPLDKILTYLVPDELREQLQVGLRGRVPLGRRSATGYVLKLSEIEGDDKLKPLREILDEAPLFTPEWGEFLRRAAGYYHFPPGEALRCALPAGLSGTGNDLTILSDKLYTPLAGAPAPRGSKQISILEAIRQAGELTLSQLREQFPAPYDSLARLVELGCLEVREVERQRDPFKNAPLPEDRQFELTGDQRRALTHAETLMSREGFAALLLHGITGSGKTEVYLRLVAEALERGDQALVLVPEIALTPQLVARFRARFAAQGVQIAVLHSGLSDGERYDAWRAIMRSECSIVIGARSAVFAPLARPGVIIVDEEHEASYKQGEGFRYHARDLALMRGQMHDCLVLLGSATPAVTTWQRLQEDTAVETLAERPGASVLPEVVCLDMTEEEKQGVLAQTLVTALQEILERKEQALLLLNRRGFAPYLQCQECGASFRCPNCEITLTFHRRALQARCHYCDYAETPPEQCPDCGGLQIEGEGAGTERLADELGELFPTARIARMDRDTTSRKGAHQRLVEQMEACEIDILVGTQMVAKGLDFPGVTLVGVVDADNTLNFPDFRAAERTFALLTQVAGRAGRGDKPGRVLVQTYTPDHYALEASVRHDYPGFVVTELAFRETLGYPPYGHLVNLVLAGNLEGKVKQSAEKLARRLTGIPELEVLGPAPCPLAKLRGKHRMQILLKAATRLPLHRAVTTLKGWKDVVANGVRLSIDVDPVDML